MTTFETLTPEIKVQTAILATMIPVAEELLNVCVIAKRAKILESFNVELAPYGSGYEIKFEVKALWSADKQSWAENMQINLLTKRSSIWVRPDSWFNQRFSERVGRIDSNIAFNDNEAYQRYDDIGHLDQVTEALNDWSTRSLANLAFVKEQVFVLLNRRSAYLNSLIK